MKSKVLTVFAAAALLAACETAPTEQAQTTGEGQAEETVVTEEVTEQTPAPGSQEQLQQEVGSKVYFAFDKSTLSEEARETLKAQAGWLKEYEGVTVTIEGHADERGTREYNLALGERRANAVKDYLTALGVDPNRLRTISYGEERPAVVGHDKEAWAKNRRAVTVVD